MPAPWKPIAIGGVVLGGLGALVLVAVKSEKGRLAPPKRVALIGDSYAVGLGPELAKLFPDFRMEAVQGTNSAQWAQHSSKCGSCGGWLPAFHPDVVLVSLGVNDDPVNRTNYQTLVRGLHGIGARVVWIEPPANVQHVDAERKIISSLGVQTVPATNVPLAADKLHPVGNGYRVWANEIAQVIANS